MCPFCFLKVSAILNLKLENRILIWFYIEKNYYRLECTFQTDHWGSVEWAHDIGRLLTTQNNNKNNNFVFILNNISEMHDTTARLAAANIFVYFNSISSTIREKNIQA